MLIIALHCGGFSLGFFVFFCFFLKNFFLSYSACFSVTRDHRLVDTLFGV